MEEESDQWTVVPCRQASGKESRKTEISTHKQKINMDSKVQRSTVEDSKEKEDVGDESLVGSFLYRPDRLTSNIHSDLIGSPFIIPSEQSSHENAPPTVLRQNGRANERGIIRLKPEMLSEINRNSGPSQPEFSLNSPSDWPTFLTTGPGGASLGQTDGSKSWSTVLKTEPPPVRKSSNQMPHSDDSGDDVKGSVKKKKKKKKKKGSQESVITEKQPLMLELGSLFESLQVKSPGSKKVLSTGGGITVVNKFTPQVPPVRTEPGKGKVVARSGNVLDSTAPQMRRGKEKEQPKKRKPTPLRKIIDKEKEERKKEKRNVTSVEEAINNDSVDLEETKDESNELDDRDSGPMLMMDTMEENPADSAENKPNPPAESAPIKQVPTIHNRRFREYCSHVVTDEINECVRLLLSELVRFQDRQFLKDPLKAKVKKRYVCGMREVLKHLKSKRIKCLIVAPNMDRIESQGGINDIISEILYLANEQELPIVFAMSRRRLGYTLKKSQKVGCVGVFRYDGAESYYKRMLELVEEAKEVYAARSSSVVQSDVTDSLIPNETITNVEDEQLFSEDEIETNATSNNLKSSPWGVFFTHGTVGDSPQQAGDSPESQSTNRSSKLPQKWTSSPKRYQNSSSLSASVLPRQLPNSTHNYGDLSMYQNQHRVTDVYNYHVSHVHSHVTREDHRFNVFAKEFILPTLNVHAPEFTPSTVTMDT